MKYNFKNITILYSSIDDICEYNINTPIYTFREDIFLLITQCSIM